MNFLSGLGAVAGGLSQGITQGQQLAAQRQKIQEYQMQQQAAQMAGQALFGGGAADLNTGLGGLSGVAPQANVQSAAQPTAGQPATSQQPQPQAAGGLSGPMTLQSVIGLINQRMPNASPMVKMQALSQIAPFLNQEDKLRMQEMGLAIREQGVQSRSEMNQFMQGIYNQRLAQGQERVNQGQQRIQLSQDRVNNARENAKLARERFDFAKTEKEKADARAEYNQAYKEFQDAQRDYTSMVNAQANVGRSMMDPAEQKRIQEELRTREQEMINRQGQRPNIPANLNQPLRPPTANDIPPANLVPADGKPHRLDGDPLKRVWVNNNGVVSEVRGQ
jgi:hypothetical protein